MIGGRIQIKLIAFLLERGFEFLGAVNGVLADFKIKVIGKKRVKLNAKQTTFCKQRAMFFYQIIPVCGLIAVRKHDGFAAKRAHFGAANVEYVAQLGNIVQRYVSLRAL